MNNIILALDIGQVRIGVAVSDALGMLAHPLTTLKWKNTNQLIADIKRLIAEKNAGALVVGMPLTLKGTASQQTEKIKQIVLALKEELDIEVLEVDERLTTKMAEIQLRESGKKASRHRDIIDQMAAVNILQSYLDRNSR